jgi:hypothetical protein
MQSLPGTIEQKEVLVRPRRQQAAKKDLDRPIYGLIKTYLQTTNYKKAGLRFSIGPG